MEIAPKTTKEVVIEVLGNSSDYGFENDERFVRHTVCVLEDESMKIAEVEVNASPAAEWFRASVLFDLGNVEASSLTCDLFYTLGRQSELGWIEEQVPGYQIKG